MRIDDELEQVMMDMLIGPDVIYIAMLVYSDESTRCFAFSSEEKLATFIQVTEETGEQNGVVKYMFFTSMLDLMFDHEYEFYGMEH